MDGGRTVKLFIVENEPIAILNFIAAAGEQKWSHYSFSLGDGAVDDTQTIRRFLQEVVRERPDIVILDAALTKKEEKRVDELELEKKPISEESLSGFKYCRVLSGERLGIPIVFLTKYGDGNVARTAMQVGADRVLVKDAKSEYLICEIRNLVRSKTPHDSAFYWPMRHELDTAGDMWQGDVLRKALDRFFLNTSSVRRFGLFTASLRSLLSPLFQGNVDAEKKLMIGLVKSQVLLSLVDPRLRDHVQHTGNVFWMGYRLLHDIKEFCAPQTLLGHVPGVCDSSGPMTPRDQLFYTWTLAALFHDYGYVDERQNQIMGLVSSLVPGASVTRGDVRSENTWTKNMHMLRDFVSTVLGHDHFLYHFIDFVTTAFGSDVECIGAKKVPLLNHGFLSAHRLLDMIPVDHLDVQRRAIVLHAALAIACHHYVDIMHKWKLPSNCRGTLQLGVFPAWSLLVFCDAVQTWGRELEMDPSLIQTEAYDGLLERLVLSDTAFISGSEICEFAAVRSKVGAAYKVTLKLRYFVEAAGRAEEACESLNVSIGRWIDSGSLREVCSTTGVSSLLSGQIIYELPMLSGTRTVSF